MTISSERTFSAMEFPATRSFQGAPELELKQKYLLRFADVAATTLSAFLGAVFLSVISPHRAGALGIKDVVLAIVMMSVALHLHGLYRRPASSLRPSGWWRPSVIARCMPTAALLTLALDAAILRGHRMTLTAAVAMTVSAIFLVPLARKAVVRLVAPTVTRVLVVGNGTITERLTSRLKRCGDVVVVGHVDDNPQSGPHMLGRLTDLAAICSAYDIDRVIVAFPHSSDDVVLNALRDLEGRVPVSEIPRFFELHNWRSEAEELHGLTLMHLPTASLGTSARTLKRIMDLSLASLAIAVASPLLLLIGVAIKLDTPGPVFFRQERTGRGGQSFRIFKFRSMTADAWEQRATIAGLNEVDGPIFKMANDPRVTRVGAFIRKTSLDELPQLINVVRGEMSLVGPRPLPTEESDRLDGAALARLDVKPGITGLWQVCGRSDLSYADLQHLDSVYVRSWSLLWDIRIMAQTPRVVFGRSGAY